MQRVAILYDASQAVLATFDLDEVLNQILAIVRDYFHLEHGSILLVDEETNELYVRSFFGGDEQAERRRLAPGQGLTGSAAKLRRPVYAPDVSKDDRYFNAVASTRSELSIPLMVRDKVVGVLDCQSNHVDSFDNETIDLLTLFAAQASIGIQNAKLYSLLQRRAAQLEAINTIAKQTTVELDLKELLDRFCAQLPISLPVDHVVVFLRDEDENLVLRAQHGNMKIRLQEGDILPTEGEFRCRAADGPTPVTTHGPMTCTKSCFESAKAEVCLPMISFGDNVGLLVCVSERHQSFSENDVTALESVADILATAVQNSRYVDRVKKAAWRDGLTGLSNRRFFEERVVEEIKRAQRYGQPLSMLMIDLDHFKNVNDEFGHLLGDEVLRQISVIFLRQLRKVDHVCRYGGEEFAVILPATTLAAAIAVAEKLRRTVEMHHFPGVPRPVTVSIGVAIFPSYGSSRDDLVRPADQSLYEAKQLGRNRVQPAYATPTITD
jgi:diguanylate cyclase (GGDEF)-like protein